MSAVYVVSALIAAGLFAYLLAALLRAEDL